MHIFEVTRMQIKHDNKGSLKMKLYSHLSLNKHGLLGESSCHRFLLSHRFTVAIDIIMSPVASPRGGLG